MSRTTPCFIADVVASSVAPSADVSARYEVRILSDKPSELPEPPLWNVVRYKTNRMVRSPVAWTVAGAVVTFAACAWYYRRQLRQVVARVVR